MEETSGSRCALVPGEHHDNVRGVGAGGSGSRREFADWLTQAGAIFRATTGRGHRGNGTRHEVRSRVGGGRGTNQTQVHASSQLRIEYHKCTAAANKVMDPSPH